MPYLVCYDIEKDRTRKKISDLLLALGLERIQYSVYMGPLSEGLHARLLARLASLEETLSRPQDSILVLELNVSQIKKMTTFGTLPFEVEALAGTQHTLFL